jgi:AraC-like DNA-binding protein
MAFVSLIEKSLECRLTAFYRIDHSNFLDCLNGLPAYNNCLLCCTDKSTGALESVHFVPQGGIFDDNYFKGKTGKSLSIDLVFFDATINHAPFFGIAGMAVCAIEVDNQLASFITLIAEEEQNSLLFKEYMVSSTLEKICICILRSLLNTGNEMYERFKEHFSNERLLKILSYMHQNIDKELNQEKISGLIFISPDYVGQFFKRSVGISIQSYVIDQRVKMGLYKLVSTSKQISFIADQVGFTDQAYFNRQFKANYGVNPLKLRQMYKLISVSQVGALMSTGTPKKKLKMETS